MMRVRPQRDVPAKSSPTRIALGRAASGFAACALLFAGCKKPLPPHTVGIALDVGGRGDQSFNDGALRGVEGLAAGVKSTAHGYVSLTDAEYAAIVPSDLSAVAHLPIPPPLVLSGKAQEDYEPNLQLLVDQGVELTIAVGFMMEPAVRAVSLRNPNAKFLLLDSPVLDETGKKPVVRPNVRAVVFREQEGSFLAGVLAGELTRTGKVGFVGGMQLPLILKFEAGFRAGVRAVNPDAEKNMLVAYTGTFDDEKKGVEVGGDLYAKGCDIVFHAAGLDGLGVIKAAEKAHKLVIGVDSDQSKVAPHNVLTSMVKHVDVAVYQGISDQLAGKFAGGDVTLGLKEGGVGLAPLGGDAIPEITNEMKAGAIADINKLTQAVITGRITVPATIADLGPFQPVSPEMYSLVNVPGHPPSTPAPLPAGATSPLKDAPPPLDADAGTPAAAPAKAAAPAPAPTVAPKTVAHPVAAPAPKK
jgi:basic membrane protein A